MNKTIKPGKITGTLRIPGSKSHTIRALLIAAMAEGKSIIEYPLVSSDALSCLSAIEALGAKVIRNNDDTQWIVVGTGDQLQKPDKPIDVGNSGTTLYLATALAALAKEPVTFTGDHQIQKRSAGKLLASLEDLGVNINRHNGDCAPYTVTGPIKGGQTSLESPTSQYLSALLLACPLAETDTIINIPLLNEQPYVEMTLSWLDKQNITYKNYNFRQIKINGKQSYTNYTAPISGDFSSAAFFSCAAAITGGPVTLTNLDLNDSQGDKYVLDILKQMGCQIDKPGKNRITVTGPALTGKTLKPVDMDLDSMPDALPILAVTASFAEGTSRIHNVAHARLKETDRIAVMAQELKKLGVAIEEKPDGLVIHGQAEDLNGGVILGHDDHRIVMCMAVAALKAKSAITIEGAEAASITFPGFFDLLNSLRIE